MECLYKLLFHIFILTQLKLDSFTGDFHGTRRLKIPSPPEINQGI